MDAHLDSKMACTVRLKVARMNKTPKFMLINGYSIGIGIHMDRASVTARVGAMIKRNTEEVDRRRGSLMNSFRASVIG